MLKIIYLAFVTCIFYRRFVRTSCVLVTIIPTTPSTALIFAQLPKPSSPVPNGFAPEINSRKLATIKIQIAKATQDSTPSLSRCVEIACLRNITIIEMITDSVNSEAPYK